MFAVNPETEITFDSADGEVVNPSSVFELSVIDSLAIPLFVERSTVTDDMLSVPVFVCNVKLSTSVSESPGAMVAAEGSVPLPRVVTGAGEGVPETS